MTQADDLVPLAEGDPTEFDHGSRCICMSVCTHVYVCVHVSVCTRVCLFAFVCIVCDAGLYILYICVWRLVLYSV